MTRGERDIKEFEGVTTRIVCLVGEGSRKFLRCIPRVGTR